MDVQIVSMSQDVSFEDGSVTNFLTLRVPSGHLVRAVVAEDSVPVLVDNLAATQTGVPPQAPKVSIPRTAVEEGYYENYAQSSSHEDVWMPPGGSPYQPRTPVVSEDYDPALSSNDPSVQSAAYRDKQKRVAERIKRGGTNNSRSVPKDDMGYPIISGSGGVDPGELMGSSGALDEDGVGSI